MNSFDDLIAPLSFETFAAQHFEKTPLRLSARGAGTYDRLFTGDDVERLIWANAESLGGFLKLHRSDGKIAIPANLPRDAAYAWVMDHYAAGATLILHNLGRFHAPLARFQRAVETRLMARVRMNAYVTPPNAQAFGPHFDLHDTYIMQVSGHKTWRLAGQHTEMPTEGLAHDIADDWHDGEVEILDMASGDFLYLPRGFVHSAVGKSAGSVHLTMGVERLRWTDVLHQALDIAALEDADLRAAVPLEGDEAVSKALKSIAEKASKGLTATAGRALEAAKIDFLTELPAIPGGRLDVINTAADFGLGTMVEKVPGSRAYLGKQADKVSFYFPGLGIGDTAMGTHPSVSGPLSLEPLFQFIIDAEQPFRTADLPGEMAGKSKLDIVRLLLGKGFLRLRADDGGRL